MELELEISESEDYSEFRAEETVEETAEEDLCVTTAREKQQL